VAIVKVGIISAKPRGEKTGVFRLDKSGMII